MVNFANLLAKTSFLPVVAARVPGNGRGVEFIAFAPEHFDQLVGANHVGSVQPLLGGELPD